MSESRDFIPTGNCVEQDAALFEHQELAFLARCACETCVQLPSCEAQRGIIGGILIDRGDPRPTVGAEVVTAESAEDPSSAVQFGEVTLEFDRQRLPADGERALRSIQQACRAGQISMLTLVKIDHPSFDIAGWVQESLEARDPDLLSQLNPADRPNVVREIGKHILVHGAKRQPNGQLRKPHLRFANLDPETYYPFVRAFVAEAAANAALGLPDPARRTTYHSVDFHTQYLAAGEQAGFSRTSLIQGLVKHPTNPWEAAVYHQKNQKKGKITQSERQRASRLANASQLEGSIEMVFADVAPETMMHIRHLFDYGVMRAETHDGRPTIRMSDHYAVLSAAEQAAIVHAFQLESLVREPMAPDVAQAQLKVDDLSRFVFSTLLPHLDPAVLRRDAAAEDIRTEPDLLLAVLRRENWAVRLKGSLQGEFAQVDQLLAKQPAADQRFWAEHKKYLKRLNLTCRGLLEKRQLDLDSSTFANLFELYRADVQALLTFKMPPAAAPRVALSHSPEVYSRIVAYLTRNPDISEGYMSTAFKLASPVLHVRTLEGYLAGLRSTSTGVFTDTDLKQLAMRQLTPDQGRDLAELVTHLAAKYQGRTTLFVVRVLCVTHSGDAAALEALLRQKLGLEPD